MLVNIYFLLWLLKGCTHDIMINEENESSDEDNDRSLKQQPLSENEMASNICKKKNNVNRNKSQLLRTPKAALLEKRRNAVLSLLKEEIYPTGEFDKKVINKKKNFFFLEEKMNEFLKAHEKLFPTKREFLTKLREVRQKYMNKFN